MYNIEYYKIYDSDNVELDAARHPGQIVHFKCDIPLKKYDMIRLYKNGNQN